jgi:cyclopropane fatty-acyl-phospholipid synthase-like methyltransferase
VRQSEQNRAWGVDLDPGVLEWGLANNVEGLSPEQQERVNLIQDDVMKVSVDGVDVVVAMNFSYMILEDRATLRSYFARVRDALADDGVFFLDAFGGYDAFREMKERTRHKGFTYVWEQASYNPIDGHMVCYIHFHFPDKSKLKKAFRYEWRLWTLPELQELLKEAGFSKVTVYWQGWDEDDEPDGDFKPATVADADAGWIAYLSAEK